MFRTSTNLSNNVTSIPMRYPRDSIKHKKARFHEHVEKLPKVNQESESWAETRTYRWHCRVTRNSRDFCLLSCLLCAGAGLCYSLFVFVRQREFSERIDFSWITFDPDCVYCALLSWIRNKRRDVCIFYVHQFVWKVNSL